MMFTKGSVKVSLWVEWGWFSIPYLMGWGGGGGGVSILYHMGGVGVSILHLMGGGRVSILYFMGGWVGGTGGGEG